MTGIMTYIDPRSKLYGHMDRLHQLQTDGSTDAPVNIEVDLANRCNLGCSWCAFGHVHTRGPLAKWQKLEQRVPGGDLMDTSLALDIVRQFAEAGARSITWTGGGEPTIHPDFDSIVDYAYLRGLPQGIYTNGTLISEDRAALLKRLFTFVYVSLDAADRDSYRRAKVTDKFDAACEGIRRLAEADGDATVGVGFLVTENNYRDVEKAAELAHGLGADYLQLRPTVAFDANQGGTITENTAWVSDAIAAITKARIEWPEIIADTNRFRMYQTWSGHGYETCWWSMLQAVVTPNGKVFGCVNKREFPAAEIGDLSEETFADVWERHRAFPVDGDCRVLCRGHIANVELDRLMSSRLHPEFV